MNKPTKTKPERWGKKHKLKVVWFDCPAYDPSEFHMPLPGKYVPVRPRPITMLDEFVSEQDRASVRRARNLLNTLLEEK